MVKSGDKVSCKACDGDGYTFKHGRDPNSGVKAYSHDVCDICGGTGAVQLKQVKQDTETPVAVSKEKS